MSSSFKDFVFNDKKNRTILLIALGCIVIQFSIFKYMYPFASYIYDSFSFIKAADKNLAINTHPIGYSKFLRLYSVFTHSDTALVAFQYLCIQASALFMLFSIFYFYNPGNVAKFVLLGFIVFNPLFWHLANLVSPDCLLASLSMVWFALLLWIIYRPGMKIIFWHAIVLFITFTFRSSALIYLFIAVIAFGLSKLPLRKKMIGIGWGIFFCGLFVCYTNYEHKKLTGYWQFSPFSGWLMANNAMYAYRYVDSADRKPVPTKLKALDNMIREYFDSTRNPQIYPAEAIIAGTHYMRSPYMTLPKYSKKLFVSGKDSAANEFKKWATIGPFYRNYGLRIIKQYPWYFARHFAWPNALNYYMPPVEALEHYNSNSSAVTPEVKAWFRYASVNVKTRVVHGKAWIIGFYPVFCGTINVVMFFALFYYVMLKGWRRTPFFNKIIVLGSTVWLLVALFTIVTSSAALRLQVFPVLVTTTFALLLIDWMVQLMKSMKQATKSTVHDALEMKEELPQAII